MKKSITIDLLKIMAINPILDEKAIMNLSLNKALKLQKKYDAMKEKEKAKEKEFQRICKKFYRHFDFLSNYVPQRILFESLAKAGEYRIVDMEDMRSQNHYSDCAEFIKSEYKTVKKLRGPGSRSGATETINVYTYRVKNRYQGLIDGQVFKDVIEYMYPKMKEFSFKIYEMKDDNGDIYLETSNNKSLYIPIKYLFEIIKERNIDYYLNYGYMSIPKKTEEEMKEKKEEVQNLLDDEKVVSFFEVLSSYRKEDD